MSYRGLHGVRIQILFLPSPVKPGVTEKVHDVVRTNIRILDSLYNYGEGTSSRRQNDIGMYLTALHGPELHGFARWRARQVSF